ncbi:peptidoglycan DD-metalloendopeptidase family protein [Stutzerimonas tarimensis]|uniref:Peptidoglycan DD-metalloendopeptidase family protein n=1 Tax=Stutzerimonas tarimensis TaxID=1507735 RepID=A0ABV7T0F6_9GAMM
MSLAAFQRWFSSTPAKGLLLFCSLAVTLAGCTSTPGGSAQVVDRSAHPRVTSGQYTVRQGDTLWAIAFRFGWDWQDLARHNGIASPYVIYPGQRIRFDGSASRSVQAPAPARPSSPAATQSTVPQPVVRAPAPQQPAVVSPSTPATTPVTPVARSASGWSWPHNGTLISRFSSNSSLNKGIDIAGELGQPILAASNGTVVYAGSGLRGYGELVIIKHNDTYVSAYGHNRRLLVREGQEVKAGQAIAEMGSTGADRVKLHFEIRRQGKPVDPLQYLPRR